MSSFAFRPSLLDPGPRLPPASANPPPPPPSPLAVHAAKLHELPDSHLSELLPAVKKIALAVGCGDYNVLQVSPAGEGGGGANPPREVGSC